MYQVTTDARARALAGDGPTLIEAVTYRLGAHTTADDPTRYVDPDEEAAVADARPADPLAGVDAGDRPLGRRCRGRGVGVVRRADRPRRRRGGRRRAGRAGMLFDNVWADDPPALAAQRAELLRERSELAGDRR